MGLSLQGLSCLPPAESGPQLASSTSSRAIAHMKPASSRATAVADSAGFFPRPISRLSRLCSRDWAFHAIAHTRGEIPALRSRSALLSRGFRR
jgi:hypothetical protein